MQHVHSMHHCTASTKLQSLICTASSAVVLQSQSPMAGQTTALSAEYTSVLSQSRTPCCCCTYAGARAKGSLTGQADIENVNPQTTASKQVLAPSTTAVYTATVPNQSTSNTGVLSDDAASPTAANDATATQQDGFTASRPFVSSKALSQALFGGKEEAASQPAAAQALTSPFAQASSADAPQGASASAVGPGGHRSGLSSRRSSTERADMTRRDSSRAEVIEEALMSSVSPFSRAMSSGDVQPALQRLSQNKAKANAAAKPTGDSKTFSLLASFMPHFHAVILMLHPSQLLHTRQL